MNAPVIWIIVPFVLGGLLVFVRWERWTAFIGSAIPFLLAISGWWLPIDIPLQVGTFSLKVSPSLVVLGRNLTLTSADQPLLALIYASVCFWFTASAAVRSARRLIPLGLMITALLVASLAVDPFLYAALLIEIAVLLAIPLLTPMGQKPGQGIVRFLIYQTIATPFILFSGWLLVGIEANPGDLTLVLQASLLLALGFAFLLAIFPFNAWIPMLTEEASPYATGFILWLFPTLALLFGLNFIDRYTWLRTSNALNLVLSVVGTLMVATAGLLTAFQRHLGRMLGYAVIMETGFSLLSISLGGTAAIRLFFLLLVPRALAFGIWAFALQILKADTQDLELRNVKGLARSWPFATAGALFASLCLTGVPLLASFPIKQALWERLASNSLTEAIWVLAGCFGLAIGAIRCLSALVSAPEGKSWESKENTGQRIFFILGGLALFGLGLFPQWAAPLISKLPSIFEHLGR